MTSAAAAACAFTTGRGHQCKLRGTTVVAGVADLLCKQHARIVATEPGQSGVTRAAPVDAAGIVAELGRATTGADIDRCRDAIARHIDVCHNDFGLLPEIGLALADARARVRGAR